MEAYERGLLTKEDTDGIDLRFETVMLPLQPWKNWLKGKESWENFVQRRKRSFSKAGQRF